MKKNALGAVKSGLKTEGSMSYRSFAKLLSDCFLRQTMTVWDSGKLTIARKSKATDCLSHVIRFSNLTTYFLTMNKSPLWLACEEIIMAMLLDNSNVGALCKNDAPRSEQHVS